MEYISYIFIRTFVLISSFCVIYYSLEKVIKDTLHKAFWDILKEQLASEPPVYKNAIQLLVEIKEVILIEKN